MRKAEQKKASHAKEMPVAKLSEKEGSTSKEQKLEEKFKLEKTKEHETVPDESSFIKPDNVFSPDLGNPKEDSIADSDKAFWNILE